MGVYYPRITYNRTRQNNRPNIDQAKVQISPMNKAEELYKLPHDVQELNRLDVQHRMWSLMIGGLYPSELSSAVQRLMTSSEPKIMDIYDAYNDVRGIEMAERLPQAQVIGVDITPLKYRTTPPNFVFKQHNLIEGLPVEYTRRFDIIHCRCVCQHVPEPQSLVNDIIRCLKPGGLALVADGEWIAFDEDRRPLESFVYDPTLSVECNIANTRKLSSYGGWLDIFGKVTRSPKYQLPNVLLKNTSAVKDIVFRECWAPTGWAGKGVPHGEEIGAIMHMNLKEFFQTSTTVIANQGIPSTVVEAWQERATKELDERRHNVWYYVSAIALNEPEPKM